MLVGREVQSGQFTPHAESFGLRSGVIRLAVNPALAGSWPTGLKARIAAASDSIAAGTLHVAGQTAP
jgi:hypothetical protein